MRYRPRTIRAKVLVYRQQDRNMGSPPIDLSRWLLSVQTDKNIGSGVGNWSVTFKPGKYRAKDFQVLDFVEIYIDDGRGRLHPDGKPWGLRRPVMAGPITHPSEATLSGDKPQIGESLSGADGCYYLMKNEVFFNPFIVSEAIKPIVSIMQLPLFGSPSQIVTAWFAIRMFSFGQHVLGNSIPLATLMIDGKITPGWIRFYEEPTSENVILEEGVAGESHYEPPKTTTPTTANEFIEDFIQKSSREISSIERQEIEKLFFLTSDVDSEGIIPPTPEELAQGITGVQTSGTPTGKTLNTFDRDFPTRFILGSGIASGMGPTWNLMQSMCDPAFNELFFDTFPSEDRPARGQIVFRPKPFWSFVDESRHGPDNDAWSRLKKSTDFGMVRLERDEHTKLELGTSDQDSFTYWMAESAYVSLGGIQQQQFMSVNSQENDIYYGRNMTFPIYEKYKADKLGMGLRRNGIRSNYIQLSGGGEVGKVARDMATLTIKAWDWYFANHLYKSGSISMHVDTEMRIGRPIFIAETDEEGYIESVSHSVQFGDQPSGSTTVGVTRVINWERFRELELSRFVEGYLDPLTYLPNGPQPAAYNGARAKVEAVKPNRRPAEPDDILSFITRSERLP